MEPFSKDHSAATFGPNVISLLVPLVYFYCKWNEIFQSTSLLQHFKFSEGCSWRFWCCGLLCRVVCPHFQGKAVPLEPENVETMIVWNVSKCCEEPIRLCSIHKASGL